MEAPLWIGHRFGLKIKPPHPDQTTSQSPGSSQEALIYACLLPAVASRNSDVGVPPKLLMKLNTVCFGQNLTVDFGGRQRRISSNYRLTAAMRPDLRFED